MTLGWLSSLCTRMQGEVRLLAVTNEADSTRTELPAKPHQYLGHSWRHCRARGPKLLTLAGQSTRSSTHHFGLLTFLSCLWDPVADKLLEDQDWAQPAQQERAGLWHHASLLPPSHRAVRETSSH